MNISLTKVCRVYRRHRRKILIVSIITINLSLGVLLLTHFNISLQNDGSSEQTDIDGKKLDPKHPLMPTPVETEDSKTANYEHYFRLDYTILRTACKPTEWFEVPATKASILSLTNLKLNMIVKESSIQPHIISINAILRKAQKVKNLSKKGTRTICDFTIQLQIGFDFPLSCSQNCQSREIQRLTSSSVPFGDPVDYSFLISLYSKTSLAAVADLRIAQVELYRSSFYLNKQVYIRSFTENRYISASTSDSATSPTRLTMSQTDKSLFLIANSLDDAVHRVNPQNIYIALASTVVRDLYIRHQNTRISIEKDDDSILFGQDATFRLLISKKDANLVAFQIINIPNSYISVDPELKTVLVAEESKIPDADVDELDERFLFSLSFKQ